MNDGPIGSPASGSRQPAGAYQRPRHPGAVIREDLLPASQMTQATFAARLGVSRLSVSELLLEKRSLTPEMAMRLAIVLRTTPETWLQMQQDLDVWNLKQQPERFDGVEPIDPELFRIGG